MIDGGLANRATDVVAAAAQISPRMVQVLFNTHYHFDHVGSNELLGMRGVRIIGHENVKKRLMTTFENPAMGRRMDALAPAGLPTETFARDGRLMFGADTLEYTHTPLAHTDGDAFVFFPAANMVHAGDLFWTGRYPVVDYGVGGSLAAMAAALDRIDKVGDANTRIIPGHGVPAATKAELRQSARCGSRSISVSRSMLGRDAAPTKSWRRCRPESSTPELASRTRRRSSARRTAELWPHDPRVDNRTAARA